MNSYCQKCGIYKDQGSVCLLGRGDTNPEIMFISEFPTLTDVKQKQVAVGKSGMYLQNLIDSLNVPYYITNAVKCGRSFFKKPTITNIKSCKPITLQQILEMKPKIIVTLGSIPLKQLTNININIESIRGTKIYHPYLKCYILPTYNPIFTLTSEDDLHRRQFIKDLHTAKELLLTPVIRRTPSIPKTLTSHIDITQYLESILEQDAVAIDLETTGLDERKDKITDISFCYKSGEGIHIKWDDILFNHEELFRKVLSSDVKKIFHNASFDVSFLNYASYTVNNVYFDIMLAYHTLTMSFEGKKNAGIYKLKNMSYYLTTEGGHDSILEDFGGIAGYQKNKEQLKKYSVSKGSLFEDTNIDLENFPNSAYSEETMTYYANLFSNTQEKILETLNITPLEYYAAMDADVTYRIYKNIKNKIDASYSDVFYNIIMPLLNALIRVKHNGVKLDIPYIDKLIIENNKTMERLKQDIFKLAGKEFNLNSSADLIEFVHGKLKIPKNNNFLTKKTKQPAMDEKAITFYAKKNKHVQKLLDYRTVYKQTSTYLEGFKKFIDDEDRIHTSYTQITTASGRLSASDPSLHTVPRDNRVRNMVIPAEGCKLLLSDLSQVELRVLAMLSNDTAMISAFESGYDFHSMTACTMFGIPIEHFDKANPDHDKKRTAAKSINFGIVYQQGPKALADSLNISFQEAQNFQNLFFKSYSGVRQWINYIKSFALKNGYVETLYGRRRYLPYVYSSIDGVREGALRQCVNTPVQGTASDITAYGIIRLDNYLLNSNYKSKIIGTIHDSIMCEVPIDEVDHISEKLIQAHSIDIPKITIPLKADLDILDKWKK